MFPKSSLAAPALAAMLLAACQQDTTTRAVRNAEPRLPAVSDSVGPVHQGFIHGRVTLEDGSVYEGRIRFGQEEEALWINYFNGTRGQNPWATHVPADRLPRERETIEIFGARIASFDIDANLGRPFMARMGDITRIDAEGRALRVTLKSGTVAHLDRYGADDLADGVQVWDKTRGVVDINEWRIRTIEFFPPARTGPAPHPLHGTVHTRVGDFTGFIQWNREECLTSDALDGVSHDGAQLIRFDTVRSITRRSSDTAVVTLLDGRELALQTREAPLAPRGIYVDDARYGRVLVSWEALEHLQFSDGGTGPAYADFPAGSPLTGAVTTTSGRRVNGRLVFDLDESETTETLDAPSQGVDYMIPFRMIASIIPPGPGAPASQRVRLLLRDGRELQVESSGDVGRGNAGVLIFPYGGGQSDYVPWNAVAKIDMDGSK